ncbi:MFS transporter [Arthrobacter ginkgonis]|uniref:MFS transporter n=1 Tax=Arthrobacter ginkgonis TaxID=1630594 RepID=A0ABP7DC02_9MICC
MNKRSTRRSNPTAVLAIILVSYFMIVLDTSIVITGLPKIRDELGFTAADLSWVQNAYVLVFGGLLLLGARAGDILGRRRVFVAGLVVFGLASLAIGAAPSAAWLLAARAVQGVGAAVLAPSSLALLTAGFPEGRERTRALAAYGATAGIGASVGLVLGGLLADWLSWRVGFLINAPIAVVMVFAALRQLPETERRAGRFDLAGAACSTLGMGSLVYGIVHVADAGWGDPATLGALAAGVVLMGGLVLNEARARQPIMPLGLFASRERSGAYLARLLFVGAMMGYFFFTTQFLQGVYGFGPLQAGLAFMPMTVVNFFVALAVPRLTGRIGNTALLASGIAATLAGMGWLSRLEADSPYVVAVALPMALIGIGQGLAFGPLTAAGIAGVGSRDAGAASGVVNTAHQLGGSLGIGILVLVAAAAGTGNTAGVLAAQVSAAQVSAALGGGTVLLALALLAVVGLVVRWDAVRWDAVRRRRPHPTGPSDPAKGVLPVPVTAGTPTTQPDPVGWKQPTGHRETETTT